MTKSDRWILSEWLVAKDRTACLGESLLYHRNKTPYAELDLIFQTRSRSVHIVEVKTVRSLGELWGREIVTRRQAQRLEKARWYLELKSRQPTRLFLAAVEAKAGVAPAIRYFEAPF